MGEREGGGVSSVIPTERIALSLAAASIFSSKQQHTYKVETEFPNLILQHFCYRQDTLGISMPPLTKSW